MNSWEFDLNNPRFEIQKLALEVTGELTAKADPKIILAVLVLLAELLKTIQLCYKNKEKAVREVNSPGLISRLYLRRLLSKHFDSSDREWARQRLLEVGKKITPERLGVLCDEVKR